MQALAQLGEHVFGIGRHGIAVCAEVARGILAFFRIGVHDATGLAFFFMRRGL